LSKIIPVILAGGSGTRLWPLSRAKYPKQFLPLSGNNSLMQETILRLSGLDSIEDIIIICNSDHRFIVLEQCKKLEIKMPIILLEPIGRNSAPAITAAALQANKILDDALLLVLPADHLIQNINAFHKAIDVAIKQAQDGKLVTFGVVPKDPNIGYGYIKLSKDSDYGAYNVEEFIEKPNLENAKNYISSGSYLWNSGMFIFRVNTLISELIIYAPKIVKAVTKSFENSKNDLSFICLENNAFDSCPSESIDYALMEKSSNIMVVPLDANWSDIGSFTALDSVSKKDNNGNVILGDVYTESTKNTYINASNHMVATIGLENLVIVETQNVILVSTKEKAHEVNKIIEQIRKEARVEEIHNRKVYRPWGWYDTIESGMNFQVKKLHVNPGGKLSLQKHFKRAEHWVVVDGIASVINGDQKLTLSKGGSTFIPIGVLHCLENKTTKKLEIIEVQSGHYLGEDDIERFEDIYGRNK